MQTKINNLVNERLLSLDFFRGATMFLLVAEFTRLYVYFRAPELEGTLLYFLGHQFKHPDWIGITFWDCIHPFFVFIVGVAMPFSFAKRKEHGETQKQMFQHTLKRSSLLLLFGWIIVCFDNGKIVVSFLNVLCSIAFWYLIAYLLMNTQVWMQISISFVLILISELLYRFFPVDGFNQAFVMGHNFGEWIDIHLNMVNSGHWSFFNKVPSTAHIIWGVLTGKLLLDNKRSLKQKAILLFTCGVVMLMLGVGLSYFTPFIKRMASSSWVFFSGGAAFVVFAFCFWLIDIKKYRKGIHLFNIVGMNPLFIYIFVSLGGAKFVTNIVKPFFTSILGWTNELTSNIVISLTTLILLWYVCYWLYKKNIFIKL